jgi:quinol-cytochrome oxidoreductase complex cytochrome b subunit
MTNTWSEKTIAWLRGTRPWKSAFRRGPAVTNRNRSLAVFGNIFLHMLPVKVREKSLRVRATYYLGSFSFLLFLQLAITGILLMLYYHPAIPQAYQDMKDLRFVVSNGMLLRNMHRLAAHVMVAMVFVHMFHVFYRGGYKAPREFNWVVGVGLLLATLLLSYTGYLLPWDQLSFWAITVGANIMSWVPGVGGPMRFLLLGGNIVGESALLRFYVLHCVVLPLAAIGLIAIHFWRVQKDGGLELRDRELRDRPEAGRENQHE